MLHYMLDKIDAAEKDRKTYKERKKDAAAKKSKTAEVNA